MAKIRVLVVDDSLFMRKVITDLLSTDPLIEVVGQAGDGIAAIDLITQLNPDVVTLDYEMPKMNGLETLNRISELKFHVAVTMVSGYTQRDAEITLKCLAAGAVDFVTKPSGTLSFDMHKVKDDLISKVKIASQINPKLTLPYQEKLKRIGAVVYKENVDGVVAIGSSTGGPAALEVLLPMFPSDFPFPILVNQHLPKAFTKTFATRLDKECFLTVVEGDSDMKVEKGFIYIAPGGHNMEVEREDLTTVKLKITESFDTESPSVDVMMNSVARVYGGNSIGIILTGMGDDGLIGMESIKNAGGKTLVQDESTSVIFGMGKEVVKKGLADSVVPLDQIMDKIIEIMK